MTVSEKLLKRIKEHKQLSDMIPEDAECNRLFAGRNQRSSGAWSWVVVGPGSHVCYVASTETMTECLRSEHWDIYIDESGNYEIICSQKKGEVYQSVRRGVPSCV